MKKARLREYYGILLNKKGYVRIYATSKDDAINLFDKEYGWHHCGNVYSENDFFRYKDTMFKDYYCAGMINFEGAYQQLRQKGVV